MFVDCNEKIALAEMGAGDDGNCNGWRLRRVDSGRFELGIIECKYYFQVWVLYGQAKPVINSAPEVWVRLQATN